MSSRRGSLEVPVHIDETLRAGLAFMTLHFPDQVATNVLTLDAWDPKSGTAEFKATAIRVDKLATSVGWPSTLTILKRPSPPVERVGGDGRFRLVLSLPSTGVF